jgi:hypothetical protein
MAVIPDRGVKPRQGYYNKIKIVKLLKTQKL